MEIVRLDATEVTRHAAEAPLSAPAPPDDGTYTLTSYFADGVSTMHGAFHLTAPDSQGVSTLTGSGVCAGGTRRNRREKCSFTVTGTYNLVSNVIDATFTGMHKR